MLSQMARFYSSLWLNNILLYIYTPQFLFFLTTQSFFIYLLLNLFNLFIFVWVGSLLLHTGFLQLRRAGATLHCGVQPSHCGGFSCCRARALGTWASVVVARGLGSCGSRAQLLRGMWYLPGPGLEPVSPALAGIFLTTVPPGTPYTPQFLNPFIH